ncbi:MAG: BRO family protein [Cyclobacteriaceae bacterium]|nr:BRO family protein [Cyclobacteriaceae bacterium]
MQKITKGNEMDIQNFFFEDCEIRTFEKDGNIWFVAKDICNALGILNSSDAISEINIKRKVYVNIYDSMNRVQKTACINEGGMWSLVFKSRKENAEKFQFWVTDDVIPSIRKTGSYSLANRSPLVIISEALILANEALQEQTIQIAEQNQYIEKLEPKAELYDRIFNSTKEGILIETALKALGYIPYIDSDGFFDLLRKDKVLRSEKNRKYEPITEYLQKGYFVFTAVPEFSDYHSGTSRLTGRGMLWVEIQYSYIKGWEMRESWIKEEKKQMKIEEKRKKESQLLLFNEMKSPA